MLVLSRAEGKADFIIHALKNNFEADAYFVKVIGKSLPPRPHVGYFRPKLK